MMQLNFGGVPAAAISAGLGDRFRYWRGVSGQRYLFSLLAADEISDLQNVVVIEAARVCGGADPVPVWLGEVDADGTKSGEQMRVHAPKARMTFVHFPSGGDIERRAVLTDLVGGRS